MSAQRTPPARFVDAADRLHAEAAELAGAADFGKDDYKWGLRVLLQSLDYDPHFTPVGRAGVWTQMVDAMASRAVAFAAMAENPGYLDNRISRPVVIAGIPRTGTTALHKLLAVDPQFQGAEKWLLSAPMPRPPRETWPENIWFQREVAQLDARYSSTPEQRAAHNMVAGEVDECLWLQRQSFTSHMWANGWSAATYDVWWQSRDEAASYDYLRDCLQLIGMGDARRWLLKNPSHILRLEQLFGIFPDALVVQTHRDPGKAIPSLCAILTPPPGVVEVDRHAERARILGMREVSKWEKGVREAMPVREKHTSQLLDVFHAEFHADPMTIVRRIYEFADLELVPAVAAAMAARIAAKPELSHGMHRYDAADYGLTEDDIREQFGAYMDSFDLHPKEDPVA